MDNKNSSKEWVSTSTNEVPHAPGEVKPSKKVVEVKVQNRSKSLKLPKYETAWADGMDVHACFDTEDTNGEIIPIIKYSENGKETRVLGTDEVLVLKPLERCLIPTGLYCDLTPNQRIHMTPRSGLSIKNGITVLNSPGKIDADYRGSIGMVIINLGFEDFTIKHGDRMAQIAIEESIQAVWVPVDSLSETERGEGGFGSTNK